MTIGMIDGESSEKDIGRVTDAHKPKVMRDPDAWKVMIAYTK